MLTAIHAIRTVALYMRSLMLAPLTDDADASTRWDIADAVAAATLDDYEARTLLLLARAESSGYRRDVTTCAVDGRSKCRKGAPCTEAASVTAWQIIPQTPRLRGELCRSVRRDATLALEVVRWSWHKCRELPVEWRLAAYA